MDTGEEKIDDPDLVEQLKTQAKKVYREALALTIVITILLLVLP